MELSEQFVLDLDNLAREAGAAGLRVFIRLMSIGIAQQTSLVRVTDRWLMRDLDLSHSEVSEIKRTLAPFVGIQSAERRLTAYMLPLPLAPQVCLFPAPAEDIHISTDRPVFSTSAPIPAQVHSRLTGNSAPIPAQDEGLTVEGVDKTIAGTRARADRNRVEGFSGNTQISNRVAQIARSRTINPSLMAEGALVRARLDAFLRRNAAHPNNILPADDAIAAQVLAIAPLPQILRALDKLDTEKHNVRDSHGYIVSVLINRILGADRQLIRDVFARVKHERAARRGGQMTLDDYGIEAETLARKLA